MSKAHLFDTESDSSPPAIRSPAAPLQCIRLQRNHKNSANPGFFSLQPLVETKLSTFRDRDRLNLRDLIDVGLIDATWPARFPAELAARLQLPLDTPEG